MRFLLTNDDGIDATGLSSLQRGASELGEAHVVAPAEEQSGVAHQVHTHGKLSLEERGPRRYALGGTPADCARVGLRGLGITADWVFAGINHGGNLGMDVYMSGTVAAAREAAILGCPAVAFSQVLSAEHSVYWLRSQTSSMRVFGELLDRGASQGSQAGTYYNVNLPFAPENDLPEIVFCELDTSAHDVRYERTEGAIEYCGVYLDRGRQPGGDVDVVFSGKIAITELKLG